VRISVFVRRKRQRTAALHDAIARKKDPRIVPTPVLWRSGAAIWTKAEMRPPD
jgi:hypothetical protein